MIARRVTLRGRVQGVGFRESMIAAAHACGVAGWVRNRGDGSVEALIQGEPDAVERALAWCRAGPPAARVTGVLIADEEPSPRLREFVRRATE